MKAYGIRKQDHGYVGVDGRQCPCCPPKYNRKTRKQAKARERRKDAQRESV